MTMRIAVVGDLNPGRTADLLAQGFADAYPAAQIEGYPEGLGQTWTDLADPEHLADIDLIVWSKSRALARRFDQNGMFIAAEQTGTRTVSFHLDRWWGLARASEVMTDPFFQSDIVVTTDGGNDHLWQRSGVEHRWLPPATAAADTRHVGKRVDRVVGKAVFIGSWEAYPHPEWKYRGALIRRLKRRFGPRLLTFPGADGRRVTGAELADIISSAAVVIGDSALPATGRYWSDRVPITLGHGGVLVHPEVDGMDAYFTSGVHYLGAPIEDIDALGDVVASVLAGEVDSAAIRAAGREAVIAGHTYAERARQIVALSGYEEVEPNSPRLPSPDAPLVFVSAADEDAASEADAMSSFAEAMADSAGEPDSASSPPSSPSPSPAASPSRPSPDSSRSGKAALAALPPGLLSP